VALTRSQRDSLRVLYDAENEGRPVRRSNTLRFTGDHLSLNGPTAASLVRRGLAEYAPGWRIVLTPQGREIAGASCRQ